jgi:phage-related protein (TIGR01555 family)
MKIDTLTATADTAPPKNLGKWIAKTAMDGWSNFVTGLGSIADKHKKTKNRTSGLISDEELEDIYIDEGLGTNIVNMLPEDMFREGWAYEFPDEEHLKIEDLTDEYKAALETIGAASKIKEGFCWARLYGGAVILIGALDGQSLDAPLRPTRIRTFEYLRVIDRSDIIYSNIKFQIDPEKPRYGMPEYYPITFNNPQGAPQIRNVHYSRIIEIHGSPIPSGATRYTNEQRYWGISVLQNVDEKLSILGSSIGSVGHLLDEFSVGKYKLGNLADILSQTDGAELIKKRVEVMDMTRSVFHSMYFDKEDDFVRDNVSFAGVPEILHILFMLVSACTGYPITRLFGVSPAGMNSTGESDMRNYYDKVRSKLVTEAEPILLRLVKIISEWKNIPEPYIKWNSLQSLTQKEQAEVDKLEADKEQVVATTYQAYINAGILEPHEARYLQFGDTLDKIPVPEEDLLPPVQSLPEEEGNEGQEGIEGENAEEGKGEAGADEGDDTPAPENDNKGTEPDGEDNSPDDENGGSDTDELADIEERIAELEEKEDLKEEEQAELEELKKQVEDAKAKKEKGSK